MPTTHLTLFGFPRMWGLPNVGPCCMKVEAYLRLTGRSYRFAVGDLRKAPRGQLPYVALDGLVLGDSNHIIDALESTAPAPLDAGLSARDRATAWAISRMLEESTVWVLRYGRFIEAAGWADTVQLCRAVLPAPVRAFMPALIRRGMRRALASQGMGRYPAAQIWDFGRRDLDCLVGVLGDHPFLLGDRPHVVDAAVFGLVGNLACEHARSPMADLVQARPSLVAYVERMRERCFPELPSWIGMRRDGAVAIAA